MKVRRNSSLWKLTKEKKNKHYVRVVQSFEGQNFHVVPKFIIVYHFKGFLEFFSFSFSFFFSIQSNGGFIEINFKPSGTDDIQKAPII